MRKKGRWIFTLSCVLIVVAVAVTLVLREKFNKDEENNDSGIINDTYATSFSLNIPSTLQIYVGTEVNLKTGFVNVTPSAMLNKLTYEVTANNSSPTNGILFENNSIMANSVGNYSIKFQMPKSYSTYYSKTINVIVYANKEIAHISQTASSIIIGETKNVNDMFEILDETYSVTTDGNTSYSINSITAQNVGTSEISFKFVEDYVEYIYKFSVNIKDEPEYEIILSNVINNTININLAENEFVYIFYQIINRDEQFVNQDMRVISQNEAVVVSDEIANDNTIKIKGLMAGESTIIICLKANEEIRVEIKVIVI